jgi:hypothetical protein
VIDDIQKIENVGAAFRQMGSTFAVICKVLVDLGSAQRVLEADPKYRRMLRYSRSYRRRGKKEAHQG